MMNIWWRGEKQTIKDFFIFFSNKTLFFIEEKKKEEDIFSLWRLNEAQLEMLQKLLQHLRITWSEKKP